MSPPLRGKVALIEEDAKRDDVEISLAHLNLNSVTALSIIVSNHQGL